MLIKNMKIIKVINKGEPLFIRLEKDEEIDWIKEKMKK